MTLVGAYQRLSDIVLALPGMERIRRWDYERIFARRVNANLFRGVFESFDEAERSAPATKVIGYDNPEPASMYAERTLQVYPTDYPVMYWMRDCLTPGTRVFDLGGHIGVSFYAYSRYLHYPEGLSWQVCDVPAVAEQGKKLAEVKRENRLTFTVDRQQGDGADIFFASGSLQYLEDPVDVLLSRYQQRPKHVIINMLPVHQEREVVTLQSIGTAFCPYKIFHHKKLVSGLESLGYQLVDQWDNAEKACEIPFYEAYSAKPYQGYYFKLV